MEADASTPAPQVPSIRQRIEALRADPNTAKAGEKWSMVEDQRLVTALKGAKTIDEVALDHKRTHVSIAQRARRLAVAAVTAGRGVAEVAAEFRMTAEELSKLIKHRTMSDESSKKRPHEADETTVAAALTKIAATLDAIEKRISSMEQVIVRATPSAAQ